MKKLLAALLILFCIGATPHRLYYPRSCDIDVMTPDADLVLTGSWTVTEGTDVYDELDEQTASQGDIQDKDDDTSVAQNTVASTATALMTLSNPTKIVNAKKTVDWVSVSTSFKTSDTLYSYTGFSDIQFAIESTTATNTAASPSTALTVADGSNLSNSQTILIGTAAEVTIASGGGTSSITLSNARTWTSGDSVRSVTSAGVGGNLTLSPFSSVYYIFDSGTTCFNPAGFPQCATTRFYTNPETGTAWTGADLNDLQIYLESYDPTSSAVVSWTTLKVVACTIPDDAVEPGEVQSGAP